MKVRNIVGAIGLSLCLSGCPNTYRQKEYEAAEIMTYHADYCIARECSAETNQELCNLLRPYDKYFRRFENDSKYGERAKKIREAIANTLSRCD